MPRQSAIHPGSVLRRDFLEPVGTSPTELARALHVPARHIQETLAGRRHITAETALRLSRYFGTTPKFWMNLQVGYDLAQARRRLGRVLAREIQPRAWFRWSLMTASAKPRPLPR